MGCGTRCFFMFPLWLVMDPVFGMSALSRRRSCLIAGALRLSLRSVPTWLLLLLRLLEFRACLTRSKS